jgi:VanZ family protein
MIIAVVVVSLVPGQSLPSTGVSDKTEHAVAYALLTLWFAGIYPRSRYVVIAIGLFALGIGIEFAQGAMQLGRQADFRDVAANSAGIAIGMTIAWLWLGGWAQRVEEWTGER